MGLLALTVFLGGAGVPRASATQTAQSSQPGQSGQSAQSIGPEKSAKVRVALLTGEPFTDAKSREAVWKIISAEPGFAAERITTPTLRPDGGLKNFDVLIFPGGTGNGQARALGFDGAREVTRWTRSGGGVIAICAGGYLVAEGWNPLTRAIELVNAKLWDDDHWARGEGFISVQLAQGSQSAQPAGAAATRTMWFENGPIFVPANRTDMPPYSPLVQYVTDMAAPGAPKGMMAGRDAVIAAPFGKGRVVVFGPHPELSPSLNHWLTNSIRWASGQSAKSGPPMLESLSAARILEGQ